jgi:hypothetical protein
MFKDSIKSVISETESSFDVMAENDAGLTLNKARILAYAALTCPRVLDLSSTSSSTTALAQRPRKKNVIPLTNPLESSLIGVDVRG